MLSLLTLIFTTIALTIVKENTNYLSKSDQDFYMSKSFHINNHIGDASKCNLDRNEVARSIWNLDNTTSDDFCEDENYNELDQITTKNTLRNKLIGKFSYATSSQPKQRNIISEKSKSEQLNIISCPKDLRSVCKSSKWCAQIPLLTKRPKLIFDKMMKDAINESLLSTSDGSITESDTIPTDRMKNWKKVRFLLSVEYDENI